MKDQKNNMLPANIAFYLGLFSLALGVTLIGIPKFTVRTIIMIIGGILAGGGLGVFIYRLKKHCLTKGMQVLQIIASCINILFGLSLLLFPTFYTAATIIIFGIAIIMGGITMLITSLSFTPLTNTSKVFVGISILMIIAGSVFIFNPFETATAISVFFGIILSIFGITNIVMSFWIRKNLTNIKNKAHEIMDTISNQDKNDKQTIEAEVVSSEVVT
jgi:uncharacterized membrane protein HdeD (DUF308 family)